MDPTIEFIPKRAAVQGVYHGHEGVRGTSATPLRASISTRWTTKRFAISVIASWCSTSLRIRGRENGVEVTMPTAIVMTFRDDKIARFEDFGERSKALEAVGLSQ